MKKFVGMFIVLLLVIFCSGCSNDKIVDDSIRFKEEYEDLNGDKDVRVVNIDEDNVFVYKSTSDIVSMMDNKESFVVYFGFASCPWCRSVVESLVEVSNDLGFDKIYYVDVKEIRDVKSINEDGEVVTKSEGTKDYYLLLEKMDNVLDEYTLMNKDGEEVETGEKRIYAPNIVSVINGEALKMTDGVSDSQNDAYMELTMEMKDDSYDKIKCSIECVIDEKEICSAKTKC